MPGGERVMLEELLIHGSYPYLQQLAKPSEKEEYLGSLVDDYLFKDVLYLGKLRLPENLKKLAVLLAFQIGSEVSLNELSRTLGIDIKTVQSYLTFLKLSFVIYELPSYSGNLRQEVTKSKKYYFWDLGIRNALINQFSEFQLRPDKGALWENWLISERLKLLGSDNNQKQLFFWRNYAQAEIDWLEITGSKISAYEFKWHGRKAHTPRDFEQAYKTKVNLVSSANFQEFLEK
jgi:predicted AAA+ superfamily ATPase